MTGTEPGPIGTAPARGHTLLPTLALLGVCAVWGSTFVVVKHAVERMPVMDFLAWRFGIAALVMVLARPRAFRLLDRHGRRVGVLLGLALGAGYIAQTVGLQHTPASISGFITGLLVVFTPLCAGVLLHQRIDRTTWFGVALATVGLALISLRGFSIGSGEALTLLCALAFALHIVGLGEWSSSYDAAALAILQLSTVAVISIVAAAPDTLSPPPDAAVWGAVLLTAVAATSVAFFVQTWAQAHLAPTRAAVVMTMEPVFAGIFGVAFGGDTFDARSLAGALLILAAMYTVELGSRHGKDATIQRFE